MDFALIDSNSEIRRNSILNEIEGLFTSKEKQIINLYGESGFGKSFICRSVKNDSKDYDLNSVLVDFDQNEYNNVPGLIEGIAYYLGALNFFSTINLLTEYKESVDASKPYLLDRCVDTFIQDLNSLAANNKILLIFDTVELLSQEIKRNEFRRIINQLSNNSIIVISGIDEYSLVDVTVKIYVGGFGTNEIKDFFRAREKRFQGLFRNQGELVATKIHSKTNGHPILCGLLSDYLIYHTDIKRIGTTYDQLMYILDENEAVFHGRLIGWIDELPNEELKTAIRITAFFNNGMTPQMLNSITGMNSALCRSAIDAMMQYSFVKYSIDEKKVVIHQVVADMIKDKYPYSQNELSAFTDKAVEAYTSMLAIDDCRNDAFKKRASLRVERIMCLVRNGSFLKAILLLDDELLAALEAFDYSFVSQLISAIEKWNNKNRDASWDYVLLLLKGELYLNKYMAKDALNIAVKLKQNVLYNNDVLKPMTDSFLGRCFVNPSTVEEENSLDKAINALTECMFDLEKKQLTMRVVKTAFWLGVAYTRNGQNEYAQYVFEFAKENCNDRIQLLNIIMELSKMLRLQQDVEAADKVMQQCINILMDGIPKKNKGKFFYYKGNIERDLGHYSDAQKWYHKSFSELKDHNDDFTLCELNLDYGWLEYLWKEQYNRELVLRYIDDGNDIAERFHFGTEFSEVHHMRYELYHEEKEMEEAYKELEEALNLAYKYSNMYMIMDCLNHKAQMHYEKKEFDKVSDVIYEMERIQENGCKIRVFTGRAMLVKGDILYDSNLYDSALEQYLEGFLIIALYGNSFSNVELFEGLFADRREKMSYCIKVGTQSTEIMAACKSKWFACDVKAEFRQLIAEL